LIFKDLFLSELAIMITKMIDLGGNGWEYVSLIGKLEKINPVEIPKVVFHLSYPFNQNT
jgi:hypothetical protein